jgi:putative membrane protein
VVTETGSRPGAAASRAGSGAKLTAIAAAVLGLLVATAVVGYFNFGAVLAAMKPIGIGGFAAVVVAQLLLFIPLGTSWWLVSLESSARAPAFMWGRLMREAASDVLPFSHLGAVLISTRATVLGGVSPAIASGSCVVDVTFEIVAQLLYTLFGVAWLAHHLGFGGADDSLILPILGGVAVATCMVVGFIATQRKGLRAVERLIERLIPSAARQAAAVTAVVEQAHGRPLRLLTCLCLHIFSWVASAGGTWLILGFIGHPIDFLSVCAIEALLFAIRNAAFMVPSGLGVQEGAYALIGPLFGLPAESALALSLLKRARDIGIGIPMLLVWQVVESRKSLRGAMAR